jgi:hypothetical protein
LRLWSIDLLLPGRAASLQNDTKSHQLASAHHL